MMKAMKNPIRILLTFAVALLSLSTAQAQEPTDSIPADSIPAGKLPALQPKPEPRKTTPVDIDDEKPQQVLHYYDKHGDPLKEPVMFLATLDTVTKPKSKPVYPIYNGVTVGVNFGDVLNYALGHKYAGFDLHADVSLHNWFFPALELGVGYANDAPERKNFTYRVKPSFYAKAGINYNFMYKSDPAYQVFLGLRAAFSSFNWTVEDVTVSNDYWQDSERFSMEQRHSTAFWGEALAGVKVKIVGNFSLGWTLRYKFPFHISTDGPDDPWYIPGYGGNDFGFTISAMWTIPGPGKKEPVSDVKE